MEITIGHSNHTSYVNLLVQKCILEHKYNMDCRQALAINFDWKYGWHRIWLESDSSYVVQLFSSRSEMVPWRVRQAWQRCIFQISQMDFQVSHIFREGNQVANTLSKHALELQADSWWFYAPSFCSSLVVND